MASAKGKEKVSDSGRKGKRKLSDTDDKTGRRKRKNPGVLQFFDDSAYQVDDDESESDESLCDDDFYDDEFFQDHKSNDKDGKAPVLPFVKQEDMSDDELERMLEERYKPGAGFVKYAEERYEHDTSNDKDVHVPSANDPVIWKVKCMVGRERYSAFCLMQKFVELEYLKTTKLHILSAFALDHVKGFIFIEAEKQNNIYEACTGLCSIYPTKVAPVPTNEMSRLLSVRSKSNAISVGTWARVKRGKYKGDLALVVAVNDVRKKVTAKLIPRIDLKAMAEKIGGGLRAKMTAIPPQRLISSSELDEFRPLIHSRRDRDTNEMVEVLDGMMLKDGYLFKKIPIDSLSFWGVLPTEAELLKFEPSNKDESTDVQWVSQLFGEKKQKEMEPTTPSKHDKGSGKSEASSSATISGNNFELHDLVFFNRKDFGVVIGTSEKDDSIKVIKDGADGPLVVSVKQSELKAALFDKKLFSVLDHHSKTILINDTVRVLDGPLKDRQGVVKKIYKGVLFLFDESEQENSGYICIKAQFCEKVGSGEVSDEKSGEPGPSSFAELFSSPKSPPSPEKTWEEKDNRSSFKRDDDAMFAVGQSLRIRVGPLKGYLCRVIAIRRTDVTVKLDSKQKILTVKSEHLSEVRGRSSAISQGGESLSSKPFDFLGTQGAGTGWGNGTTLSTEGGSWNAGGSTERSSWAGFDSSNNSLSKEPGSADPVDDDTKKGAGDSSWQTKTTSTENSSWGAAAADKKVASDDVPASGWGTSSGWNQTSSSTATNTGSDGWGKAAEPAGNTSTKDNSWGTAAEKLSTGDDTSGSKSAWGQPTSSPEKKTGGWGNASGNLDNQGDMKKDGNESSWGKGKEPVTEGAAANSQNDSWSKPKSVGDDTISSTGWGAAQSGGSGDNLKGASGWGSASPVTEEAGNGKGSWDKEVKQTENNNSSWNSGTTSVDGNKSPQGNWGSQKPSEPNSSSWNQNGNSGQGGSWNNAKKDADGGSSTGWGQSTGGNQESSWSSKGNWNSGGGGFGSENNNQNDGSSDRGRGGGGWRGGRGGRGDRGGFQGRGRSDFGGNQESTWGSKPSWSSGGGFGDNNGQDDSSNGRGGGGWSGGRGGRGDRGGFRGRGGSDGGRFGGGRGGGDGEGGFRGGRGGYRGRGRGDFNNRGGDNEGNKSNSWNSGSNEGWKSNAGGNSWGSSGGNSQGGGWGSSNADANTSSGGWSKQSPKKDVGGGWGSSNTNADASPGGWNKQSPKKDTGGGWGSSNPAASGSPGGWNRQSPKKDTGGGWGSSNAAASQGNPATSSWGASASGNGEKEKDGGGTSSWGGGSSKW